MHVQSGVAAETEAHAKLIYQRSVERLLNVNAWGTYSSPSKFQLFDENRNKTDRLVEEGDFIRIDIPGLGTEAGMGYDWVRVEAIGRAEDENYEWTAIRVRPSSMPCSKSEVIAHFLDKDATSTFKVSREGYLVFAEEFARNETTNTNGVGLLDMARNFLVGAAAKLGVSYPQWKSLTDGLLQN